MKKQLQILWQDLKKLPLRYKVWMVHWISIFAVWLWSMKELLQVMAAKDALFYVMVSGFALMAYHVVCLKFWRTD